MDFFMIFPPMFEKNTLVKRRVYRRILTSDSRRTAEMTWRETAATQLRV